MYRTAEAIHGPKPLRRFGATPAEAVFGSTSATLQPSPRDGVRHPTPDLRQAAHHTEASHFACPAP